MKILKRGWVSGAFGYPPPGIYRIISEQRGCYFIADYPNWPSDQGCTVVVRYTAFEAKLLWP